MRGDAPLILRDQLVRDLHFVVTVGESGVCVLMTLFCCGEFCFAKLHSKMKI